MTWPGNVTFSVSSTKTLLTNNWIISGTLTCSTTTQTINHTTSETLSVGGLTVTGNITGTAETTITGGSWQGSGTNTLTSLNLAGNISISGVSYSTGTITYMSGTISPGNNTLTVGASTTFNTNGMTWHNIIISAAATITLNSLLSLNGTLQLGNPTANITFAGTSGFSTATLACNATGAATITLVHAVTYTITTALNCSANRTGSIVVFTSDDGTIKAILTLNQGATCNVLASFTRIDASAGRPILSFNGTITTCTNVFAYTDVQYPPSGLSRHFGKRKLIYNRGITVLYEIPCNAK